MNAVLLMVASLVTFQGEDQKVTGSIDNNSGLQAGTPYQVVYPRGTFKISGPVTKVVVKTWVGQRDKSGKFVQDHSIGSGEAATSIPAKIPPTGEFNWWANSFTFPGNYPKPGKEITVKATLEVYGGTPPELKVEETGYQTIR